MKTSSSAVVLLTAFAALASPAAMAQDTPSTLSMRVSPEHGQYVADGEGMSLYMFEADSRGESYSLAESTCYDECAEAWPPLITQEPRAGTELNADLLGTIERRDGQVQVTYGGWPLYGFVRDESPGDTTGHKVEGFGGAWSLVTPDGHRVGREDGS